MKDQSQPLSSGIDFPHGFDTLPQAERLKVHRKNIQAMLSRQGSEGAERYKARYPEAAVIRYQLGNPRAYLSKPEGYTDAIASMVDLWFNSYSACEETNTADVRRLNAKLGTTLVPANHFNGELSSQRKKRLAKVFASHGAHFDPGRLTSLSKVREAVKSARLAAEPDTVAFGRIGRRNGNKLIVSGQEYTITKNGPTECIRPCIGGKQTRISLDALLWMSELLEAGNTQGEPYSTLRSNYVEQDYLPDCSEAGSKSPSRTSLNSAEPDQSTERLSLAKRITRLRSAHEPASDSGTDSADPLEINLVASAN